MSSSNLPVSALADPATVGALRSYRRRGWQWLVGSPVAALAALLLLGVGLEVRWLSVLVIPSALVFCGAPTGLGIGVAAVLRARMMRRILAAAPWEPFPVRIGASSRGRTVLLEGTDTDRSAYVLTGLRQRLDRFLPDSPETLFVAGHPAQQVVVAGIDRNQLFVANRPRRAEVASSIQRDVLRPPLTESAKATMQRDIKIALAGTGIGLLAGVALGLFIHWTLSFAVAIPPAISRSVLSRRWDQLPRQDPDNGTAP